MEEEWVYVSGDATTTADDAPGEQAYEKELKESVSPNFPIPC